jgi:septum formation protein
MDELASEHGFQYSVLTADIDEQAIRHHDPTVLVSLLAHAKAAAIKAKMHDAGTPTAGTYLITADQVVTYKGQIREKPSSIEEVNLGPPSRCA